MRKMLLHTLSLIAIVLLSLATSSSGYGLQHSNASSQGKSTGYTFSSDQHNHYSTPRQNEVITIVGSCATSEGANSSSSLLWGYVPAFEHKLQHATTQYMLRSVWQYRSLTISDIIYPFDYFW
ncbi:hypothetical protein [uncultured Acetobacteroides sp.]|uniref:hypothetical protein n=1 Tax=uncultured Acetobacteroides sp. TaxID=1760811 RepID=UPI0029F582C2|nr:hypothetical protein [uncultured Acetobacteroides sp.]